MRLRRREAWTPGRARVPHARDHRPLPAHPHPLPFPSPLPRRALSGHTWQPLERGVNRPSVSLALRA